MMIGNYFCTLVFALKRRDVILNLIKVSVYCICLTLFIFLMQDVWYKFTTKITSNGIRIKYSEEKNKLLPCFTARPYLAYKKPGFVFTDDEYEQKTLKLEDIFSEESVEVSISATYYALLFLLMCYLQLKFCVLILLAKGNWSRKTCPYNVVEIDR